jgi:hypothetical protein
VTLGWPWTDRLPLESDPDVAATVTIDGVGAWTVEGIDVRAIVYRKETAWMSALSHAELRTYIALLHRVQGSIAAATEQQDGPPAQVRSPAGATPRGHGRGRPSRLYGSARLTSGDRRGYGPHRTR